MVLASEAKGVGVARSHGVSIDFQGTRVCALYSELDFAKRSGWARFIVA